MVMQLLIKYLSYLPMPILYRVSDFAFFVTYRLIKYRRDVVRNNLLNAFPEKKIDEIITIERKFYKNLADSLVESLKMMTISEAELKQRVKVNDALPSIFFKKGKPLLVMTSHQNNWEWLLQACANIGGYKVHAAYQRLRNKSFDELMIYLRSRFGVVLHEKNDVVNDMKKLNETGDLFLMAMVADQRPFSGVNRFWTKFMHQDAAFYSGTELLAKRFDIPVAYVSMKRVRRGYYEVSFTEVKANPTASPRNAIIQKYVQLVEADINAEPSAYLWTHDRWKLKKPVTSN